MLLKALLLGLLAGFAIWDGRVFGQHMFDRPIVTGPIVGLILGDVQTGIVMGASLELVMMGIVGIGAATPPDVVAGGILSTAFAIMSGLNMDTAVALSLPIATLAQSVGILDRTINTTFLHWADKAAQEGDADKVLEQLSGTFDFIFMDAAKGQYIHWLPRILELMAEGALLVTDNVLQDGDVAESRFAVERRNRTIHARMRDYLYTLTHMEELKTSIVPIGDGVALSVKILRREP